MTRPPKKDVVSGDHVEAYLKLINELLVNAPPMGAYCLGMSGPLIFSDDPKDHPDRALLEKLRACTSVQEGTRILYLRLHGGKRKAGAR